MRTPLRSVLLAVLISVLIDFSVATKPKITNAKLQEVALSGADLKATVNSLVQKQGSPAWIGYRIPVEAKEHTMCCFDSLDQFRGSAGRCCLGCRMDSDKGGSFSGTA